jgi:multidrug transporter EmrE-like cation transporter
MSPYIFIGFSTLGSIFGQLLLKAGMSRIGQSGSSGGRSVLVGMVTSPRVMVGLFVYGLGVIFWLLALSNFELSYVYPFASLSYIGIILGSYFIFRERITLLRCVGIAAIVIGVLITSQS